MRTFTEMWTRLSAFVGGMGMVLCGLSELRAQTSSISDTNRSIQPIKVGLVLSGGGAKAMAHIGLLKVMEEEGLRPDRIAGTSMGSVVGALFAMGYSASRIEAELRSIDWESVLTNERPSAYLPLIDKGAEERYLISFPIEDGQLKLPNGINYGQSILINLARLTLPAHDIRDFSQLPIPFSCMATDLETGAPVVLDTGRLADALRASTSFPTLYSPYRIGNRILVDGGLVSNFPSSLVSDSVDVIIGSDVQDEAYKAEDLNSILKVLEQISSFVNAASYHRDTAMAEVLVRPYVPGAGITTFNLFDSIVRSGYRAAEQHRLAIRALAQRQNSAIWTSLPFPENDRTWYVTEASLEREEGIPDHYLKHKLGLKLPDSLTLEDIEVGMNRLYGRGVYRTVDYRLLTVQGDSVELKIRPKERNPNAILRFGLHYDIDFQTALLVNFTRRDFLMDYDRLKFDVAVGTMPRLWIDYRLDRDYIPSIGFKLRAHRLEPQLYAQGKSFLSFDYWDVSANVFFLTLVANRLSLEAGVQYENIWIDDPLDVVFPTNYQNNYLNYYGELKIDFLDRISFPRRGFLFKSDFRMITESQDYSELFEPGSVLDLSFLQALHFGKRWFAHARAELATTIGPDLNYEYSLFLGGLGQNYIQYSRPFAGYQFMELTGRNMITAGLDVHYEFYKDHLLIAKGNIGKLENNLQRLSVSNALLDGYAFSYAYLSPVGPLQFSVHGSTNHPWVYTYVNLGFWF